MGILNVTPDSFSDGGLFIGRDNALKQAEQLCRDGADIIDVGGESTRPGAEPVTSEQELDRVIPVIEALAGATDTVISIDTSKPIVMRAAVDAGAGMINDVCALAADGAVECVAALRTAVCLMHMRGEPRTMQENPEYDDVVADIADFLRQRVACCAAAGIDPQRILVDPGFGFGKTVAHNLRLLRELREFSDLGAGVLVGLSRKSLIGKVLDLKVDQRAVASAALALFAVTQGARVVRVHDVRETRDAIRMWEAVAMGF